VEIAERPETVHRVACDERRGPGRIAIVQVACRRITQRPDITAIVGPQAAEEVDPVGEVAVDDDDVRARRRNSSQSTGGEPFLPDDLRLL
jgi:hypothetical protein